MSKLKLVPKNRPIPNLISESPLLKKTERRRSRSRSRQRIDSELVNKIEEQFPIVKDVMEYIINTYGVIKDANPLLKESLQRSEDAAFWMKQKAEDVVVATKLDAPLKQLDTAAAKSLEKMEEATTKVTE